MTQVSDVSDVIDVTTPEGAKYVNEKGKEYPDLWIEEYLGCNMWSLPKMIARAVFAYPRVAVASASSTSKSHTAARVAVAFLYLFTPSTVITTAPTFRQVESILWREIREAWGSAKVELGGQLKATEIHINEKWFAIGLSTDEPERFQGLHNENVLVIGDEASGLSPDVYVAMENPLSSGNAHQLLIGNPTQPVGDFRDCFESPAKSPLYKQFHISCFDTPNFTEFGIDMEDIRRGTYKEKIESRPLPRPYLISPDWVYERFQEWGENNILFQCYCLGKFPEAGVNTLVPAWVVDYCMETVKIEPKGQLIASLDVSRYGDDETVFGVRQGNKVIAIEAWSHQDTTFTAGRTARFLREYQPVVTIIDAVGVGAGVVDNLKANGFEVQEYNGAEKPLDTELFGNSRAEDYWHLQGMLKKAEIDLPPHPKMKSQLADLRYRYDIKNRLFIESKEQARNRGVNSPDYADMLCMLFKPINIMALSEPSVSNTMG